MRRLAGVLVAALAALAPAATAGTLPFDRVLPGTFEVAECSEGGVLARCFLTEVAGLVPGLGRTTVSERVLQSGDVDLDGCEPQVRYGRITTTRGAVEYRASGIDCPATREQTGGYRAVVVHWEAVGGTGAYAGVTGAGDASVRPDGTDVFIHLHGVLDVPGVAFDRTAPELAGADHDYLIRASKPTVVRYRPPDARDAVDGETPVSCAPASGRRFRVGRTKVTCTATDSSGNTAEETFLVVVKRR
jgi:hypothetical protein